ncbi:hypothetical protein HPB52_012565 [Rhipicephalus sanguineus]|uniref:Uncharacterized protein n=1 Tax=Rhipicephalus sanguineus TaxID=34632 RepID=A0A9D4PGF3_RHISA|nr:hypothetical protein HPB52_012565 [Rhipicephalus sanguineus]
MSEEASGERPPMDESSPSKEDPPSKDDVSPGEETPRLTASPSGDGTPKTTSSSSLTTARSISLGGELSYTSGDPSTSKSGGDRSSDTSPTSQGSISPKSPESKRQRRSSVAFAKQPIIYPVPARSRSAPVSPPGPIDKLKSAMDRMATNVKKFATKQKPTPPVNTWMKEVRTRRYRCVCGRLFNRGECPSSSSEAAPSGACNDCGTVPDPTKSAPLAETEDLSSPEDEASEQQEQVSIVVEPPSDEESSPEKGSPSQADPEGTLIEELGPDEVDPEGPLPEEPCRDEAEPEDSLPEDRCPDKVEPEDTPPEKPSPEEGTSEPPSDEKA